MREASLYDGGNQLCWSGTASTSGYTCPSHPGGGTTYSYNSRGDLTNNGGTTLSYDLADRPTQVVGGSTTDTYTYDGAGNRLTDVRAGVTTNFTWDVHGSLPLLATDSDGSASSPRDYVYGDGLMYERAGSPVKRYYYTRDAFGSVSDVTDPTAVPMEVHTYDPFGAKRTDTVAPSPPASYANLMEFDGEYHDPTGYYNLRAREYLPGQGRFSRSDSVAAATSAFLQADPLSASAYAFANDRPTVLSDPTGMFPWGKLLLGILAAGTLAATCLEGGCAALAAAYAEVAAGGLTSSSVYMASIALAYGAGATEAGIAADEELTSGAAEAGGAASSSDAMRLAGQLTEQEARSVFTSSGALQPEVIANSTEIINGTQLGNQTLVKSLTAEGGDIADWGKYTTQTFRSPSGPFQVHFYYNSSSGQVFYSLDYKTVFVAGGR